MEIRDPVAWENWKKKNGSQIKTYPLRQNMGIHDGEGNGKRRKVNGYCREYEL